MTQEQDEMEQKFAQHQFDEFMQSAIPNNVKEIIRKLYNRCMKLEEENKVLSCTHTTPTKEQIEQAAEKYCQEMFELAMKSGKDFDGEITSRDFIAGINYHKSQLPDVDWEDVKKQWEEFKGSSWLNHDKDFEWFKANFKSHLQRNNGWIKTQVIEIKETKKAISLKLEVPLNSFKLKDIAFGYKILSVIISEPLPNPPQAKK